MELEPLLLQLQTPNTQVIKAAEERLKVLLKRGDSVRLLMEVVAGSQDTFARHIAAIVLRRRLRGHWSRQLGPEERATVRGGVLQLLGGEPERLVRNSIASVVAEVARLEMGEEQGSHWPELFGVISTCAGAPNDAQRECAYVLLLELAPAVGHALLPHHETLLQMFTAALADCNGKVRTTAMRAVSALLRHMARTLAFEAEDEDESAENGVAVRFASLVPALLQVATQCLVQGEEEEVCEVLDVFGDLVSTPLPLINDQIHVVLPFLLEVMRTASLDMQTRDSAALVLNAMAEWRPKLLGRSGFIPKIMEVVAWLIASSRGSVAGNIFSRPPVEDGGDADGAESDTDSDAGDGPGQTEQGIAQSLLDQLALNVPTTYILEPTLMIVQQCLSNEDPGSDGAAQRKAGCCMLAVVCEGCQEYLRTQVAVFLPLVIRATHDDASEVQEAACFCLGQMAEHLTPEILQFPSEILPAGLRVLESPLHTVQCVGCYLLEQYCEHLQPAAVRPFLEPAMARLLHMLQVGRPDLQEKCISAISALAVAAEEDFTRFLPMVASPLMSLLEVTDEVFKRLRGGALEALGRISIAVGPDAFAAYLEPCMLACSQNLTLGDSELTEFTFCFMANLIKAFGPRFNHFLPQLLPSLCGAVKDANSASFAMETVAGPYAGLVDDDDDEDDGDVVFNVHTGVVDMQRAGLAALSAAVGFTEGACVEYTAEVLEALASCFGCWTEHIRTAAAQVLQHVVSCSMTAHPPPRPWVSGEQADGKFSLADHTCEVVRVVVELVTAALEQDTERDSVGAAVTALKDVIDLVGPFALCVQTDAGWVINEGLLTQILKLLWGQADCQTLVDEDAALSAPAHDADHDVLMDAVFDILPSCAHALGPAFRPYLDQMLPRILYFAEPQRPQADRAMAMGTLAELIEHLGREGVVAYGDGFLPVVRQGLQDPTTSVQRNAAYALGVFIEAAADKKFRGGAGGYEGHYASFVNELRPIFAGASNPDVPPALIDNTASAMCRLIAAAPDALPVGSVLDELVLPALPIRSDTMEARPAYGCLINLLMLPHPDLGDVQRLSRVLSVLALGLGDAAATSDATKHEVAAGLRHALPGLGETGERAMQALPVELRAWLARALQ